MGLTIHYTLKTTQADAHPLVAQMRQLALDLPFDHVGELEGTPQKTVYFYYPWNKCYSIFLPPIKECSFLIDPGPGCETATIGLAQYPETVELEYSAEQDKRFQTDSRFDYLKWRRYARRNNVQHILREKRQVPTKLSGWHWSCFCKTQYACESGVQNFLKCHISLITLLERIGKIVSVKIDDEGCYGPYYGDDLDTGKYRWYKGRHNPAALVKEVGMWNEVIAGMAGALGDLLPLSSPIKNFQNFEQLEFRGRKHKQVQQFLEALSGR